MNCRLVLIAYLSRITHGLGVGLPASVCVDTCQWPCAGVPSYVQAKFASDPKWCALAFRVGPLMAQSGH